MRNLKRKWLIMLAVAVMVASLGILFAGCSGDDDDDNGNGGTGPTGGSACDQLCQKVCDMGVQCGELPNGSCTSAVVSQCGDQMEVQVGNSQCQQALGTPLNCSMY